MDYRKRLIESALHDALRRAGAVLIEGAKGCGKTSTAERMAASVVRIDVDPLVDLYMSTEPERILDGSTPRLLDEWQRQPRLWDFVRRAVDDRQLRGQFILTGSATPNPSIPRHSGAGRFAVLRMKPMTLFESGLSNGTISLQGLLMSDDLAIVAPVEFGLQDWSRIISRGGWPATLSDSTDDATQYVTDYLSLITTYDIRAASGVRRNQASVNRLISSLARNTSSEATITTLSKDAGGSLGPIMRETTAQYLDDLEQLMVIEPLPAWQTALRDSARLRRAPKWHFVDPSLAVAAMQATPDHLLADPKTLGLLFESLAVRDLRVYADLNRGELFHARDSFDREADIVIEYPDGWVACEVKLGIGQVDDAAAHLLRFTSTVDTSTVGPCKAQIVIVGAGPGYKRPDGVFVVPLATLRP